MDKHNRQQAIRDLVRDAAVTSQAELVHQLQTSGFPCTQASVSRDLRELGLVKAGGRYVAADHLPPSPEVPSEISGFIQGADPVGANLVVVRTKVGAAQQVGLTIDELQHPDVAGTIAGDDTIFIAVGSRTAQGRVLALLRPRSPERPRRRA